MKKPFYKVMMFDIIIKNSKLFGLEKNATAKSDIGITDGIISAIGNLDGKDAKKVIDGEGLYTMPGFVDVHSHSDYYLFIDPDAGGKVMQGITTDIGGNCGYSSAPIGGDILKVRAEAYKEQFGLELDWSTFDEYWKKLKVKGSAINFVGLIGYNTLRASVIGLQDGEVTEEAKEKMKQMVRDNLDMGAAGISIGLVYPPACFAKKEEVAEIVAEVGKKGKIFTTHIRSEGRDLLDSIDEVIEIAKMAKVKLHISHLKTAGKDNWEKLDKVFEKIEKAKNEGVDIECDRYPYIASNTGLQVLLPDWAFDGGRDAIVVRLQDDKIRKKFTEEILKNHPEPEYWKSVMVSQVATEKNYDLQGLTVEEGAKKRGKNHFDFIYDLLIEEKTEVEAIYFCMSEKNMERVLLKDYVMVGSDAGSRTINGPLGIGRPHPRTFGTFPRFMREYVFDKKLISMEDAVLKTSTSACERFGLEKRGKLIVGYHADIVTIDPKTIRDTTTYENPLSYPEGIVNVLVNGVPSVLNGKYTGELNGRGIAVK